MFLSILFFINANAACPVFYGKENDIGGGKTTWSFSQKQEDGMIEIPVDESCQPNYLYLKKQGEVYVIDSNQKADADLDRAQKLTEAQARVARLKALDLSKEITGEQMRAILQDILKQIGMQ